MAIFDFLRNKGKKLFGGSRSQASSGSQSGSDDSRQQQQNSGKSGQQQSAGKPGQQQSAGTSSGSGATSTPQASTESKRQGDAIREHILSQDDVNAPEDLVVLFDADEGVLVIEGVVPDEDTAEAIVLIAGDIDGVCTVDDRMSVEGQKSRSAQPKNEELRNYARSPDKGASPGASARSTP
jgi:hypothetical protein